MGLEALDSGVGIGLNTTRGFDLLHSDTRPM
uniref:Uncharacterized protein n=1 Tax=Lepeophtheirus salmonis TaxID=72036 RepID=A0A0K2UAF7_LEPSM